MLCWRINENDESFVVPSYFQFCYPGTDYYLGKLGTACSASEVVSDLEECKDAATKLGRTFNGTFNLNYRPAGCYYLHYNYTGPDVLNNNTNFNLADQPFNIAPTGGGVCKKGISDNL